MKKLSIPELQEKSAEIRQKVIDFHRKNKIAHLGPDLSAVEILTTLQYGIMHQEDRFILSKGHASGLLYVVMQDIGKIPANVDIAKLEGHPTINPEYGIWTTGGSLGHGLSIGLGLALARPNNRVYVLMGDGECDEGQIWEAARTASELGVKNLVGIVDCNRLQGLSGKKTSDIGEIYKRFEAFGWQPRVVEGHNCTELNSALSAGSEKPLVVLAKTIKGKGVPSIEGQLRSHYVYQGDETK